MRRYLLIFLVFIFLFTFNFNSYNEVYASTILDSNVSRGVMTILSMLVAGGLVTYNNVNSAKALAFKLYDMSSSSFRQTLNNINTLKEASFLFTAGLWKELIDNLKAIYNSNFNYSYILPIGSSVSADMSKINFVDKYSTSQYIQYTAYIIFPFNSNIYFTNIYGYPSYFSIGSYSGGFVSIVEHTTDSNGNSKTYNATYSSRDPSGNPVSSGLCLQAVTTHWTGYSGTDATVFHDVGSYSTFVFGDINPSSSFSASSGSISSDSVLSYNSSGVVVSDSVLNTDDTTLSNSISSTNVKIPTYDNSVDADTNINNLLNQLIGVDTQTYNNSLSNTNILSNILSSVSSIANSLTYGLVGDVSKVNFQPLRLSVSALTTKFPFSLPWDLYNVFFLLNVSPQVPKLAFNLSFGSIHVPDVSFDFSWLDPYMGLFRWSEYIIFCIGLILATRRLFGGAE